MTAIFYKKIRHYLLFVVAFAFIAASVFPVNQVYAQQSECDTEFYSRNDIYFYNPCEVNACSTGGGSLTAAAPSSLQGDTNADKVWNYFTGRGLSPVAAAGAMGNIEQESSFNPLIVEGANGIGFGLIQWSFERRTKLEQAAAAAGVSFSAGNEDASLLFQLNYLWDGEYGEMTWQEPVNAETTVEGDPSIPYQEDNTGNGSTLVFHKLVERSGDGASGKQERIDSAKVFLEKYGGSTAGGAEGCTVGEGGLTVEQAEAFMRFYADIETDADVAAIEGMSWFFNPGPGLCPGKGNCTAFSTYFLSKYTSLNADAMGDGINKVERQLAINPGVESGSTPRVFSMFSGSGLGPEGHTAIILGIEGDKVIIGEANCGQGREGIKVRETTVAQMSSGFSYMYLDQYVDQGLVMEAVGNGN